MEDRRLLWFWNEELAVDALRWHQTLHVLRLRVEVVHVWGFTTTEWNEGHLHVLCRSRRLRRGFFRSRAGCRGSVAFGCGAFTNSKIFGAWWMAGMYADIKESFCTWGSVHWRKKWRWSPWQVQMHFPSSSKSLARNQWIHAEILRNKFLTAAFTCFCTAFWSLLVFLAALLGLSKPSYLPEARSLWDERWLRNYIPLGVSRIFPTKCFLEVCGYVRIRLAQDLQDSITLKCDHLTHSAHGMSGLAYTACNYLGTTFLHFLLGGLCCICTAVCGLKFAAPFWQELRVGEQLFSSLLVNCQTAKVLKLAMPSRQWEIDVFEGSETCGEGVCSCGRSWGVWDQ